MSPQPQYTSATNSDNYLALISRLAGHQFFYLNQGSSPTISGVDDAKCFDQTQEALSQLGLERRTQTALLRTLAAVLHLGNVEFREEMAGGEEACSVSVSRSGGGLARDSKRWCRFVLAWPKPFQNIFAQR